MSLRAFWFNDAPKPLQQRRPELDLLRFIAALLVMAYHFTASGVGNTLHADRYNLLATTELVPGLADITRFGFLGVPLFFLISGFIIFASAAQRSALDFAVFRWIRLFPVYWVSIGFTLLVLFGFLGWSYPLGVKEIALNFTMLQSYLGAQHLDPVYWTLVLELHFYALIFFALLFNQLKAWRLWTSLYLVAALVSQLTGINLKLYYLLDPAYGGYFIAGMVSYSIFRQGHSPWSTLMLLGSYALCCTSLPEQVALYNFGQTDTASNGIAALLVLFAFAAVLAMATGKWVMADSKTLLTVGALTYPLYLTHHQFGRYGLDALHTLVPTWLLLPAMVAVCLGIAWFIAIVVEAPLARKLKQLYRSLRKPKLQQQWTTP